MSEWSFRRHHASRRLKRLALQVAGLAGLPALPVAAAPSIGATMSQRAPGAVRYPDAYNVVWDSPSKGSAGSMPLGNGDIGINAWVEANGDLLFLIGKTDAWSENNRLLKLGRVRVSLSPNPFAAGRPFEQALRLREGEILIRAGERDARQTVRLWVDANHPAIRVEVDGTGLTTLTVRLEMWRTADRVLQGVDLGGAYGMEGAPEPAVEHADVLVPNTPECVVWYHRNPTSIYPLSMRLQGLESLLPRFSDPLLHRTFGGLIRGPGLSGAGPGALRSREAARRHQVSIHVLTRQTDTPEEWLRLLEEQAAATDAVPPTRALAAHRRWWRSFWDRSRIQVSGRVGAGEIATNPLPLRIGADSEGQNGFRGDIRRARVFGRALSPEEVAALAHGNEARPERDPSLIGDWSLAHSAGGAFPNALGPHLPALTVGEVQATDTPEGKAIRLDGRGWLEVAPDPRLGLRRACTLDAWVRPGRLPDGGGRILDKSQAGTSSGYLLDTYPGNSLRMIVAAGTLRHDARLAPGEWTHVAATYDAETGEQRLYVNGVPVASQSLGADAAEMTRGYVLQRFISACAGRGGSPIKFNGSIFTVDPYEPGEESDPDYRRWGGPYWFQNTRLAYWPMLASGDFDLTQPLFGIYRDMLPLARERTRLYFGHGGAFFPETLTFWGTYANSNYGWSRDGKPPSHVDNTYIRWYWQGGLELCALLLDHHAYTRDRATLRDVLFPLADAVLAFYDRHHRRGPDGKLRLEPAQALETWQDVVDPLPDIAGLQWVLDRLLELPPALAGQERRAAWQRLRAEVPSLPEEAGVRLLAAREIRGPVANSENPELYAIFPYRLYGVAKPGLDVARRTFARRQFPGNEGWRQDPIQAALLGLADEAAAMVARRLTTYHPGSRFPAFWGPNFDWIPDQDHGTVGVMALQTMLLQADGGKIRLLPAWPRGWDVRFRLHAPGKTVVECTYRAGRIERLVVTPASRRQDVVLSSTR